jgi:glutamine synthetase
MTSPLRDFLEIPYDELEELNLQMKALRLARTPVDILREERCRYLADEKRIKAVTVCFADLEGRLHMLDYDKKFLLKSADNLTFDGSSIRGFSRQAESDLRLAIDWAAFYWLPADVFGPGKVLVFGDVLEPDGTPYSADIRSRLKRASFLPKPVTGVNGSGMHTNLSIARGDTNLFYDAAGRDSISTFGWSFINRILHHARDLCLILNSSVNAYRRLDPHYEAPNEIKASPIDRGAMIRIPIGNARSARIEVRSIAPDANPYLAIYSLLRTGLEGAEAPMTDPYQPLGVLPDNIYDALDHFRASAWIKEIIGGDVAERFASAKQASADRCPRLLGTIIKRAEIQFHHEVTNQHLWNFF